MLASFSLTTAVTQDFLPKHTPSEKAGGVQAHREPVPQPWFCCRAASGVTGPQD